MRRYIDAENLPRHGNRGGVVYWRDIEEQPTADVRENVRGEWVTVYMTLANNQNGYITEYECNKCNEHQIVKSNFCPNCGADMRGES